MMKDPTLKDWGKFKVEPNTIRISVSVEVEEWRLFDTFVRKN